MRAGTRQFALHGSVGGFAHRVLSHAYACRAFTKFGSHLLKGFANAKAKSLAVKWQHLVSRILLGVSQEWF